MNPSDAIILTLCLVGTACVAMSLVAIWNRLLIARPVPMVALALIGFLFATIGPAIGGKIAGRFGIQIPPKTAQIDIHDDLAGPVPDIADTPAEWVATGTLSADTP